MRFKIGSNRIGRALFGASLLLLTVSDSSAQQPAPSAGQQLFNAKTCGACHGKNGAKAILAYPNLAGNDKTYLLNQINDIGEGRRIGSNDETGNPRTAGMKAVVHLANGEEIGQIAEWLSTQPSAKPAVLDPAPAPADLEKGKTLYQQKGCVACHGEGGKKPIMPGYPYLAGQKKDYLAVQIKDVKSGARANGLSAAMKPVSAMVSDEEIESIAAYLSQETR